MNSPFQRVPTFPNNSFQNAPIFPNNSLQRASTFQNVSPNNNFFKMNPNSPNIPFQRAPTFPNGPLQHAPTFQNVPNALNISNNPGPPEIPLPYIIDDFNFVEKLGGGYFGKVYKGININTKEEVAIKAIYKNGLNFYGRIDFYRELWALENIHSENIVKFIKYFQDQYYHFIAMER